MTEPLSGEQSQRVNVGVVAYEAAATPQENVTRICAMIRDAVAQGLDLIVFPECAVQGYPTRLGVPDLDQFETHNRFAEPIPGPATRRIAEALGESRACAVVGLTERADTAAGENDELFNSVALINQSGVIGKYRKVHTGGVEKCLWQRGDRPVVASSPVGRLGFLICYDLVFPELARTLVLSGAQLLVMSTAWANTEDPTFVRGYDLFTRARALENQVFLASANLAGGTGLGFHGHSRIVDPRGDVIAESVGPGIAVASIDLIADTSRLRARSWLGQVFVRDREPRAYSTR
jgi:predicted amidohydrolase